MSGIEIKLPKEPTPAQARAVVLAILEAWEAGLERGYSLSMTSKGEGE